MSRVCREDGARLSMGVQGGKRMRGKKNERREFKIRIMEINESSGILCAVLSPQCGVCLSLPKHFKMSKSVAINQCLF